MSILDCTVSAYPNALAKEGRDVPLLTFLKSSRHTLDIEKIRQCDDEKRRAEMKRHLPAATISGTFSVRNKDGINEYNSLICLDFDGKDNKSWDKNTMKKALSEFAETAYTGVSVGGKGVFSIIKTNNLFPERHAESVELLGRIIEANTGLKFDPACKDVCRLRFVSFDAEAYFNHTALIFDVARFLEKEPVKPRPIFVKKVALVDQPAEATIKDRVEKIISDIEQSGRDVTDRYADWVKIGFALAAEFGPAGADYFVRISQFHKSFDRDKTLNKYNQLCQQRKNVSIASFFHLTK